MRREDETSGAQDERHLTRQFSPMQTRQTISEASRERVRRKWVGRIVELITRRKRRPPE